MLASSLLFAALASPAADLEHGAALFASHCRQCHGVGGKLDPEGPVVKALPATPKDFSDPLFNSREPRADWAIVIRHGGSALGFSSAMPAFGSILSDRTSRTCSLTSRASHNPIVIPTGISTSSSAPGRRKPFPRMNG
jgi:mono/diheme cytochrome c family protein